MEVERSRRRRPKDPRKGNPKKKIFIVKQRPCSTIKKMVLKRKT
jgi:hypothetical protein